MKTKASTLITIAFIASALLGLAGCATEQANTMSLLTAAGFHTLTPQTAQQKQIYAALPAYQVQRATVKGKVFYVFKDEKQGIAYVGREAEYQAYQRLAIQQQMAQQYYQAVQMDQMYAGRWYGAWGMRAVYWR